MVGFGWRSRRRAIICPRLIVSWSPLDTIKRYSRSSEETTILDVWYRIHSSTNSVIRPLKSGRSRMALMSGENLKLRCLKPDKLSRLHWLSRTGEISFLRATSDCTAPGTNDWLITFSLNSRLMFLHLLSFCFLGMIIIPEFENFTAIVRPPIR